jgi:hypothetical protein
VFSGQTPGDDRAPANGSSISFILEIGSIRVLLAADAHATTLAATLRQFAADRGLHKVPFDCIKLPHHGSMSNVSADWLSLVDCEHWLISTNGAVFGHPDIETAQLVAAQSKRAPKFYCNYLSDTTQRLGQASGAPWDVVYPPGSDKDRNITGIALNLKEGAGSGPASVKVAIGSPRPARAPAAAPRRPRSKR